MTLFPDKTMAWSRFFTLLVIIATFLNGANASASDPKEKAVLGKWDVVMINSARVDVEHKPWLEFLNNGKLKGYSGMNSFDATYVMHDNAFSIKFEGLSSMNGGEENLWKLERALIDALNEVNTLKVNGEDLELLADGKMLIMARRVGN